MWFDVVLIDKLFANGALQSFHIRSDMDSRFAVDRLEDINPEFRAADTSDLGPLRIYEKSRVRTAVLESQLKNFDFSPSQILVQMDHYSIPVVSGYYAIIFPKGWRVSDINVYDPFHDANNIAEKRSYRGIDVQWDPVARMSCAQFNMESKRRGTFSIGVIASLCPCDADVIWQDRPGRLNVEFSDTRHNHQPDAPGYRLAADVAVAKAKEGDQLPGVKLGLSGPSIDIVEWGRFIRDKVRKPKPASD